MFEHFALHRSLTRALKEQKLIDPTPIQVKAIPPALDWVDLRMVAETGSGKTLAYLIPTLHHLLSETNPGGGSRALILLPTRELAMQVHQQCELLARFTRLKVDLLIGGEDFIAQTEVLENMPDVLIATPGRLLEHLKEGNPDFFDLRVLVLDEADRMLDMGFSDAVQEIASHCNEERQTMMVSATAGPKGMQSVAHSLMREPETILLANVWDKHANIQQQLILSDGHEHKLKQLSSLLNFEKYDKALVFANSRDKVEKIAGFLMHKHIRTGMLHGELDQAKRSQVLELLREGRIRVLVATDVAARGLDIEGIELVINFEMARRGDTYLHRIGRTGRAGNKGLAITLIEDREWNLTAGIERYLKQKLIRREIPGLVAAYTGPKKLKASGKAAGSKQKKTASKKVVKVKKRLRDKKNVGKRRKGSAPQ